MEKVEKRTLELRERANIIRRAQAKIDKENGEKRYKCNECPSKYANSGTLYRHKQTHATNCNFRCGICERVFKTELTLYFTLLHILKELSNAIFVIVVLRAAQE